MSAREEAREAVVAELEVALGPDHGGEGKPPFEHRCADAASDVWEPMVKERDAEIDRLNHEVMAHQVGDGYEKGYQHGSLAERQRWEPIVRELDTAQDGILTIEFESSEASRLYYAAQDRAREALGGS